MVNANKVNQAFCQTQLGPCSFLLLFPMTEDEPKLPVFTFAMNSEQTITTILAAF